MLKASTVRNTVFIAKSSTRSRALQSSPSATSVANRTLNKACLPHIRNYAPLSRYPERENRFTRSSVSSQRKLQKRQDVGKDAQLITTEVLPLHTPPEIPKDPDGVLQLATNRGAATLLGQSSLIVTRELEMMNIFLGFEQANKYALISPEGNKVGYLAEEETSFTSTIQRQLLKTHRPFKATVLDLEGNPILRISRGVTLINSRTRIWSIEQTPDSTGLLQSRERLIGEVVQNFHVWRRKYELFRSVPESESSSPDQAQHPDSQTPSAESKNLIPSEDRSAEQLDQFAKVDSGLLSWDFLLQDQHGAILGAINRNFRGFGRELFTDTGQYVVRFRDVEPQELHTPARLTDTPSGGQETAANPQSGAIRSADSGELILEQDSRPMTLDMRAVGLAAAVTIDFDYFSRHSSSGGGFHPFLWMPGGSPPPPEGDAEVPAQTSQDSSGIQSSPELPGSDGGLGSGAGTAAGYGMMGGGSQYENPSNDNGFNSPPSPEAETQSDGWGFGSREEQGMGQNEEVWGGGDSDPWAQQSQGGDGNGGGGLFGGWGLGDFLGDE